MTALPDTVVVAPLGDESLSGRVRVPGDKSLSHRALLLGAQADGPVEVTGAAPSADVLATAAALRHLGCRVDGAIAGPDTTVVVEGPLREADDVIDCGNSGTGLRLLAGVAAGVDGVTVLTGDASLRSRPMDRIAAPLRAMGATVDGRDGGRLAPLVVRGGDLRAIEHTSPVASAQVKSAVLLAGLHAAGTTRVREPGPSRDHTERMLAWLGADAGSDGDGAWVRPSRLRARPLRVAADPSSAAFWLVAAAALPGSRVEVADVCLNPTRTGAVEILREMGAAVTGEPTAEWAGEPVGDLSVHGGPLGLAEVDGDLVVRAIDELPVLAVAGALGGGLRVRDAQELRVKESDRIESVARMLAGIGVQVDTAPDGFTVSGGAVPRGGAVDSGGDHRIAMAAAIAALACREPVTITGFACVGTSYPSFLDDLAAVGGRWSTP